MTRDTCIKEIEAGNEFAFRLNEGNCQHDITDRMDALVRGVVGKRLTYKMLTQGI
jgi:hypothetical protein